MAALLIVAGITLVQKQKEKKRIKRASADARYRELQIETNERLARYSSGNQDLVIEDGRDDEEHEQTMEERETLPGYEDAVGRQQARLSGSGAGATEKSAAIGGGRRRFRFGREKGMV